VDRGTRSKLEKPKSTFLRWPVGMDSGVER
jgi:hypothetical protein